jgi:Ca-activated chloride channel family protein
MTERATWLKGIEAYLPLSFNRTVVRSDLIAKRPEVAKVLSNCKIPGSDIGRAMRQIAKKGTSPKFLERLAREWIDSHHAVVESWFEGISERAPAPTMEALTLAYSPEKEELIQKLAIAFNLSRQPETPPIRPIRLDMASMLEDAMDGSFAAISPDSSIWLAQLDRRWQKRNPEASPLVGHRVRCALSPIVIAMWEKKAAKMGFPGKALGWEDLMKNASTDPDFKWCHPSATTASGLLATTAEFYAGAGKQGNLTKEDLQAEGVLEYVKAIEATVERYGGESEDRVVIRMLAEGGYPLDAFVAQEQLVIFFNCNTQGEKLTAIYPKEGTFWMDHPLVLLDGPWVTEEQKRGFREFASFVAKPEQQRLVLTEGYRPAEVGLSLQAEGSLIKPEYNVDPDQPKTLLKVPSDGVVGSIRELWRLTKKPANIYLVVDVSGSMAGEKLSGAKGALLSFIDQIEGERDKVALVAFSGDASEIQRLRKLDRERFGASIRGLKAEGGTMLYDAVAYAFDKLQKKGESKRINVIVAMTDGQSQGDMAVLESKLRTTDFPVLIFTVAYGGDADLDTLQRIAQLGDGRAYPSDPETIGALYQLLSAYF